MTVQVRAAGVDMKLEKPHFALPFVFDVALRG